MENSIKKRIPEYPQILSSSIVFGHFVMKSDRKWSKLLLDRPGILLSVRGEGEIFYRNDILEINPGEAVVYSALPKHLFHAVSEWECYWCHLPEEFLAELTSCPENTHVPGVWLVHFGQQSRERILAEFRECYLLYLESKEQFAPGISGLLKVILRRMVNELNISERENALSQVFEPLLQELNPPWKKLNLTELARMCKMSRATFFRHFREFYGCTPIQYRDNILIFHAKHLLVYSALRITEISDRMGFPDQFYFCKFFRAKTGCSPSRFRLQMRNMKTAFGCDDEE